MGKFGQMLLDAGKELLFQSGGNLPDVPEMPAFVRVAGDGFVSVRIGERKSELPPVGNDPPSGIGLRKLVADATKVDSRAQLMLGGPRPRRDAVRLFLADLINPVLVERLLVLVRPVR